MAQCWRHWSCHVQLHLYFFLHLFLQRREKVEVKIQRFLYHQQILHATFVRKSEIKFKNTESSLGDGQDKTASTVSSTMIWAGWYLLLLWLKLVIKCPWVLWGKEEAPSSQKPPCLGCAGSNQGSSLLFLCIINQSIFYYTVPYRPRYVLITKHSLLNSEVTRLPIYLCLLSLLVGSSLMNNSLLLWVQQDLKSGCR